MDEQTEASNQLNAFLSEGKVDVVFCMSGFGETVSQAAYDAGATIPVVGLALCSNAYEKLPNEDQDTYGDDVIMPFSVLWDLGMNGYGAGAGMVAYLKGEFDGKAGSEFTSVASGRYEETTFKCVDCPMDEGCLLYTSKTPRLLSIDRAGRRRRGLAEPLPSRPAARPARRFAAWPVVFQAGRGSDMSGW